MVVSAVLVGSDHVRLICGQSLRSGRGHLEIKRIVRLDRDRLGGWRVGPGPGLPRTGGHPVGPGDFLRHHRAARDRRVLREKNVVVDVIDGAALRIGDLPDGEMRCIVIVFPARAVRAHDFFEVGQSGTRARAVDIGPRPGTVGDRVKHAAHVVVGDRSSVARRHAGHRHNAVHERIGQAHRVAVAVRDAGRVVRVLGMKRRAHLVPRGVHFIAGAIRGEYVQADPPYTFRFPEVGRDPRHAVERHVQNAPAAVRQLEHRVDCGSVDRIADQRGRVAQHPPEMHRPTQADRGGFPRRGREIWSVGIGIGALHLEIEPAVAGDEQIDVVPLQLAGERVDALVCVLVDIIARAREPRLLVEAGDGLVLAIGESCPPKTTRQ